MNPKWVLKTTKLDRKLKLSFGYALRCPVSWSHYVNKSYAHILCDIIIFWCNSLWIEEPYPRVECCEPGENDQSIAVLIIIFIGMRRLSHPRYSVLSMDLEEINVLRPNFSYLLLIVHQGQKATYSVEYSKMVRIWIRAWHFYTESRNKHCAISSSLVIYH